MDTGKITYGWDVTNHPLGDTIPTAKFEEISLARRYAHVSLKIYNKGSQPNPSYAHEGDAGMDLRADSAYGVRPGEIVLVKTGIHLSIPVGYEVQIRPRSGISAKSKLRIANSPGTIDSNYRGEIQVICENIGNNMYEIKAGDRIAQMVVCPVMKASFIQVDSEEELGDTTRGSGGFGSTGKN